MANGFLMARNVGLIGIVIYYSMLIMEFVDKHFYRKLQDYVKTEQVKLLQLNEGLGRCRDDLDVCPAENIYQ